MARGCVTGLGGWAVGGRGLAVAGRRGSVAGGGWALAGIAAMAAGMVVAGCGGGADEGPAPGGSAAVSTEKPVEQPILTMPTSTYTGMHAEAFKRINEARIAAGVSALKQSVELDRAAQAHSDYQMRNNVFGHFEDPAHPLFTGINHTDRAKAQKYEHQIGIEVISLASASLPGSRHIDMHLNSVYHLHGVLTPTANEIGIGLSLADPKSRAFGSISTGVTDSRMPTVKNPWNWPVAGATDVPRVFIPASEMPNPLPDIAPNTATSVGPPVMFCQRPEDSTGLKVSAVRIVEQMNGSTEPVWLLKHASAEVNDAANANVRSDPNATVSTAHCIFIIPKMPLKSRTQYEVSITASRGGKLQETKWSFMTED